MALPRSQSFNIEAPSDDDEAVSISSSIDAISPVFEDVVERPKDAMPTEEIPCTAARANDEHTLPPAFAVAALSTGISCGYMTALIGIVVPKITASTHPKDAALVTGIVAALGSIMNLLAPLMGRASDALGSRLPLTLAGILVCLVSYAMQYGGVVTDSYDTFAVGTVFDHLGVVAIITMLNTSCIEWGGGSLRATNVLSGISTLFQLVGAACGYSIAGAIMPVTDGNGFFIIGIGLSAFQALTLLVLPREKFRSTVHDSSTAGDADETKLLKDMSDGNSSSTHTEVSANVEEESPTSKALLDHADHRGGARYESIDAESAAGLQDAWTQGENEDPARPVFASGSVYRDLLIVTGVRFAFFMGVGALTNNLLYYIEDRTSSSQPELTLSMCALVALLSTIMSLPVAVWLCGKLGTLKSVWVSTVALSLVLVMYPLNTSRALLFIFASFLGSAQGIGAVADLVLVGQCIPDERNKARDIAFWSVSQSLGLAVGSAIFGWILNLIGKTDRRSADGGRVVYSATGYTVLFWTSSLLLLLSSFALFWVRAPAAYETTFTKKASIAKGEQKHCDRRHRIV